MVAREQGFAYDCAWGSMLEIWHDAWVTGQCADDRIEAFRSALAECAKDGGPVALGLWHVLFAECLEKQGNIDEALTALEAAVVHFERTGDALWEPEVHRLIGDLLLRRQPERSGSGGSFLSAGDRASPFARGEVVGIARRHQPRPAVARPRQARRGARAAGAGLRLVHRGLRHRRSEGCQSAARPPGVSLRLSCAEVRCECPPDS